MRDLPRRRAVSSDPVFLHRMPDFTNRPPTDANESVVPEIRWEPWSASAFQRASRERKPVLLALTASWCHGCDVMDRTTYRDPDIVRTIDAAVVPIRVDTDRRPDVNVRYNLDGWPTTALLTPSGEILTGSTYLPPAAMAAMLAEGTAALGDRYEDLMGRAEAAAARRRAASRARYEPDGEAPAWLAAHMAAEYDAEYGGFGAGGRFLHAALLRFALTHYAATRDERMASLLAGSLDRISRGAMFDEVDGGFFRYAAGRDFTRPHTEKMLEDQVALVGILLDAATILQRPDYRDRAVDVVRYVRRTLSDTAGSGFFASQKPDVEFYTLSGSIRRSMDPPEVDRTLFTDLNAQAIIAWLDAAAALADPELQRFALRSADRVLLGTHDASLGHRHWTDADATADLLTDQVHAAAAWIRLFDTTGDRSHLGRASEVMRTAVRRFWDAENGGFFDRAPGGADELGMLRDPVKPLALNSLAARVLKRIAAATGDAACAVQARQALGSVTGTYRSQGLGAAPYALAVLEVSS
jgi:uncharacterized protein